MAHVRSTTTTPMGGWAGSTSPDLPLFPLCAYFCLIRPEFRFRTSASLSLPSLPIRGSPHPSPLLTAAFSPPRLLAPSRPSCANGTWEFGKFFPLSCAQYSISFPGRNGRGVSPFPLRVCFTCVGGPTSTPPPSYPLRTAVSGITKQFHSFFVPFCGKSLVG